MRGESPVGGPSRCSDRFSNKSRSASESCQQVIFALQRQVRCPGVSMFLCGYAGICGYMWIYVDICGYICGYMWIYMWIYVDMRCGTFLGHQVDLTEVEREIL